MNERRYRWFFVRKPFPYKTISVAPDVTSALSACQSTYLAKDVPVEGSTIWSAEGRWSTTWSPSLTRSYATNINVKLQNELIRLFANVKVLLDSFEWRRGYLLLLHIHEASGR